MNNPTNPPHDYLWALRQAVETGAKVRRTDWDKLSYIYLSADMKTWHNTVGAETNPPWLCCPEGWEIYQGPEVISGADALGALLKAKTVEHLYSTNSPVLYRLQGSTLYFSNYRETIPNRTNPTITLHDWLRGSFRVVEDSE